MPKCLANAQKLDPKWSNVTSSQPIMLWRIKFEVNSTNSRQLCRTDRSHFWQDFYDTKFRSEFGVWQQYSPRRLQDSLSSNFISGLNLKWIFDRRLCFFGPWHKTIFQTFLLTFCDRDQWKSWKTVHEVFLLYWQLSLGWRISCFHSIKIFWPMKPSYTSN